MAASENYHTVIVGAGPGGLACARLLAQHGLAVLVIERQRQVGPKVCAGGITSAGLHKLLPAELIEKSFADQYIRSNWQNTRISAPAPIISTINREKLGQWMLGQVVAAGAVVKTGTVVRAISDRYVSTRDLTGGEQRYGYEYLVGADGSTSLVRRYLQIGTSRLGIGIQYQVPGNFDKMEWHLNAGLFKNGYAWIFPHRDRASVGIYGDRRQATAGEMLKNLQHWARRHHIDLRGLQPRAALINFDYRGWRFGNKMLVGDAAGLTSGLTGEGIYPALVSGEAAARTIISPAAATTPEAALDRLIRKQQKHQRVLRISGKNNLSNKIIMEMLILALRTKLLSFRVLEMA